MPSEEVTLEGHILDLRTLSTLLDEMKEMGASYQVLELRIGSGRDETSFARVRFDADDDHTLEQLIQHATHFGANADVVEDARLEPADVDGAFPPGFYSTTNLETEVRIEGSWIRVRHPEMDCGIVVEGGAARTIPMAEVRKDMPIVMGGHGIRVLPDTASEESARGSFEFMSSDVSSEKPKALLVDQVAAHMRAARENGKRILWVAGPAVIHTGSAPDVCALIRAGYVNAFFAGNGVAAHDIESNIYGTSLGIHLSHGGAAERGHEHHIRAINELRRHGSFKAAMDAGLFKDGIVYELVKHDADYVFGGSVRDDGPLPEVITDMVAVQRRLRDVIWGRNGDDLVGYCIVVGTMLHGIATGNCLPASVPLACVDINQATVTKLMDRGSWQSMGIITDVGLFIRQLAERLAPDEIRDIQDEAGVRDAGSHTPR